MWGRWRSLVAQEDSFFEDAGSASTGAAERVGGVGFGDGFASNVRGAALLVGGMEQANTHTVRAIDAAAVYGKPCPSSVKRLSDDIARAWYSSVTGRSRHTLPGGGETGLPCAQWRGRDAPKPAPEGPRAGFQLFPGGARGCGGWHASARADAVFLPAL